MEDTKSAMADKSLKSKTIKGVGWSSVDSIAQHTVSFVVSIVLARLLSPDDYGLLGLVGIFTAVCQTLILGGFSSALIRKKDITDDDYNTAFIVNLGMSLLLYGVVFLGAPWIADFFQRQELVALVRVASVSLVIGAFAIVQQTKLTKRIDFKTQMKITLVASIVSGIVGIVLAWHKWGVWALVAQQITSNLFRTVLLCLSNRWFPKLRFSLKSFHELFGFGWKLMVSGLLDTVWKDLYQGVVGKFYSPGTLGQYTRAKHFSVLFSSNLTHVIQRVTYPVLSNIQDDKERMVAAYRKIIKLTMFATLFCMFALGAVSTPLLNCLIGAKWHEASTYLPFICFIGAFYPLHAINLNMLQVQGRSDIFLILEICKKTLGLVPLFVGAFVGIIPMLCTSILTNFLSFFLNSYYTGKKLGYSSWRQLEDIALSFTIALVTAIAVFSLQYLPLSYWLILPLQIVVWIGLFWGLCLIFQSAEYKEMLNIAFSMLRKKKAC
jgi:O-antigen/teichoic acid export membrane protein